MQRYCFGKTICFNSDFDLLDEEINIDPEFNCFMGLSFTRFGRISSAYLVGLDRQVKCKLG